MSTSIRCRVIVVMRSLIETFIKHKLSILKRSEIDPFQVSESDIKNVNESDQLLLDSDKKGDKDAALWIKKVHRQAISKAAWFCLGNFFLNFFMFFYKISLAIIYNKNNVQYKRESTIILLLLRCFYVSSFNIVQK